MPVSRKPFVSPASRRMQSLLSGDRREIAAAAKGVSAKPKTKAEERAARALSLARMRDARTTARSSARNGVKENPMRELERKERERKDQARAQRGTSLARVKRHGNKEEEEEEMGLADEVELDRSAAEASLGIASPLPRSILRPPRPAAKRIDDGPEELRY